MKEIFEELTTVICGYLRINENLFFCSKNSPRIIEARQYFSYIAYYIYKIPPSKISGYLGVVEKRSSITIDRAKGVQKSILFDKSSQTALDIAELSKTLHLAVSN